MINVQRLSKEFRYSRVTSLKNFKSALNRTKYNDIKMSHYDVQNYVCYKNVIKF